MTSWPRGGSRKEQGGYESLFGKLRRTNILADKGLKNTSTTPAAMGFLSLPADIIKRIVSYLTFLDRFQLKIAGNHSLAALISTLPGPSFQTCLAQLAPLMSKIWTISEGREKVLYIACEEGYDALVLRLLHKCPDLATLECLERCLAAAIICHQESVVRILLVHLPTEPYAFFSKLRRRKIRYKTKTDVMETALKYATMYNCVWAIPLLLKHGEWHSPPSVIPALDAAARYGHEEVVTMLSNRILWQRGSNLSGALLNAVREGHEGTVKILLDKGAEIPHNPSRAGAKHLAAKGGYVNIFKLLVSKDSEDYFVDLRMALDEKHKIYSSSEPARLVQHGLKWCCLHFAIYNRHYNIVKYLLENDIMPQYHVQQRETALPLAAMRGCADTVKLLLDHGFDVSARLQGKSALELAARFGYAEVMPLLLDAGAVLGSCELLNAACSGSTTAVSLLVDKGSDIEARSFIYNETPLHLAITHHHPETVRVLLKSGAKTEVTNRYGYTPLSFAIGHNQEECIRLLVEYGADVEFESLPKKGSNDNALCYAIDSNKPHLIPLLLDCGADIEAEGYEGKRPLHQAASQGNSAALEILLTSGANKNATDAWLRTALHHAALNGNRKGGSDAILTLLRWGLDIHGRDKGGQTPLHKAQLDPYSDSSTVYDLLLKHGADPEVKDNNGNSAASYLAEQREACYDRLTRGQ